MKKRLSNEVDIEELISRNKTLEIQNTECEGKLNKNKMILEIIEKENELLKSNIKELYDKYNETNAKLNSILYSRTYKISEKTRKFIRRFIKKR